MTLHAALFGTNVTKPQKILHLVLKIYPSPEDSKSVVRLWVSRYWIISLSEMVNI
jgi:hypothetical protein